MLLVLDEPTAFLDVPSRVELMGLLRQLTRDGRLAVVVSTHDLELALRTADVVWLLMPGGEIVTGAPEDVVLAGGVAQAFEGRQIRFHPEERAFRLLTGDRGTARVDGTGLRAAMARAVLEREGYGTPVGERVPDCDRRRGARRVADIWRRVRRPGLRVAGGVSAWKENGGMSISTMRGDGGETSLAGGVRVSKASARVETYGTIDELNSSMGLARSICEDAELAAFTRGVQQDLFKIGSSLATPAESPKPQIVIDDALVDRLTAEVHKIEAIDGMLADWSIPGEHRGAAAYDVARTICRRAERALVRLREAGATVQPAMLAYVNRLSDLLWLFGRKLEHDAGVSGSLRESTGKAGNRFSRAW